MKPQLVIYPHYSDEERRDLTHLTALAIDDAGNQDLMMQLVWKRSF